MKLPSLGSRCHRIAIRAYLPGDLPRGRQIIHAIGTGRLGRGLPSWEKAFDLSHGMMWAATWGARGKVVGFGGIEPYRQREVIFHTDLVDPEYQGQGVGTALTLARLATTDPEEVNEIGVLATQFSRTFYERFGFVLWGEPEEDPVSGLRLHRLKLPFGRAVFEAAAEELNRARVKVMIDDESIRTA